MNRKIVFVGLSGGVDSAVSATLLKNKGYEVIGVFIKTWHPNFLECNEEKERHDAMRVAAHLDIPFLTFNFEDVYKKEVADYMISEYKAGRTPNPDVMCNKEVKFGAFLKEAITMGADYVATGHYALTRSRQNCLDLVKAGDSAKDQSYFLWTLTQEQLSKILFPVGHLKKTEVRTLAKKFRLPVAEKKDSQGICFLGAVDLKKFLKHYIKEKKGKVKNIEGKEIGYHDGAVFHTLGERHGFMVTKKNPNEGPYYIVGKDVKRNILTVAQNLHFPSPLTRGRLGGGLNSITPPQSSPYQGEEEIRLINTNWVLEVPDENKIYTAEIRYHGEFLFCRIVCLSRTSAKVIFEKPVIVAPGQSCVIYDGDVCLGGGVVA